MSVGKKTRKGKLRKYEDGVGNGGEEEEEARGRNGQ